MALSDADIELYARQIVLPGFGAAGQARVCASTLLIAGEAEELASRYARAAGFRVCADAAAPDCAILAGARGLDERRIDALAALPCPIVWFAVEGRRLRAGVRAPGEALPPLGAGEGCGPLEALAAADAVATAVAVMLGWDDAERSYEVGFD